MPKSVEPIVGEPYRYWVESSVEGEPYLVDLIELDGNGECTCGDFTCVKQKQLRLNDGNIINHGYPNATRCKHINSALLYLADQIIQHKIKEDGNLFKIKSEIIRIGKIFLLIMCSLFFSLKASAYPPCSRVNEELMLQAISDVENSVGRVGRYGERSPWQIMPSTWHEHTSMSFRGASLQTQKNVALRILRHYSWILELRGINPMPRELALMWNAGPNATQFKMSTLDYADRVNNCYYK